MYRSCDRTVLLSGSALCRVVVHKVQSSSAQSGQGLVCRKICSPSLKFTNPEYIAWIQFILLKSNVFFFMVFSKASLSAFGKKNGMGSWALPWGSCANAKTNIKCHSAENVWVGGSTHPAYGGTFHAELTHQCLGPGRGCSHVKNLTLGRFPNLEMSFHCVPFSKIQSSSEKCSATITTHCKA